MRSWNRVHSFVVMLLLASACGGGGAGGEEDGGQARVDAGSPPDAGTAAPTDCAQLQAASLADIYSKYFGAGTPTTCVTGCHGSAGGGGGFTFSSASELWLAAVNQPAKGSAKMIVTPGDPTNSYLYEKLAPGAASRMPVGGPYLSEEALREVAGWICAGAPK